MANEEMPTRIIEAVFASECSCLIRTVDALFDKYGQDFKDYDLKFPEIVVVGTESVGKSSLLEKIAGFPMFPRGEGITTRFPFRLRLHHCSAADMEAKSKVVPSNQIYKLWGYPVLMKFEGDTDYLSSPEAVRRRVQAQNEHIKKSGLGFNDKEMVLSMYGVMFPSLTLLDTPGLLGARGPDDPIDIVEKCREIVTKRIENEDSIILAVLNARNSIRGTAAAIQIIQQKNAEPRTLAVLTTVDRTGNEDGIPDIMRQMPELGLPRLAHHYHAVIGRDVKRSFTLRRADPADCAKFEDAVKAQNYAVVEDLLGNGLISEEVLDRAAHELSIKPSTPERNNLLDLISKVLAHTRAEQEKFEEKYFAPLSAESGLSEFQREQKVDERLLAEDLLPYLGSKSLASRLSEMLTKHIGLVWSPKMLQQVKSVKKRCETLKAACGDKPPPKVQIADARDFLVRVADAFSKLASVVAAELLKQIVSYCTEYMHKQVGVDQFSSYSCPEFRTTKSAALGLVKEYKTLLSSKCKLLLHDKASPMLLFRFPVFRNWLTIQIEGVAQEVTTNALAKVEALCTSLEPDTFLEGLYPDQGSFDRNLFDTVTKAVTRIVHVHVVKAFFERLKQRVGLPPLDHAAAYMLNEADENAAVRSGLEDKLRALKNFECELKVINAQMAKKYQDEGFFDVDSIPLPPHWQRMPDLYETELYDLQPQSAEHREVVSSFTRTAGQFTVLKVQRVQSGPQWNAYENRKKVMDQRLGIKSNEKFLFHGTSAAAAEKIYERGFNRSFAAVHAFGIGTYFARDAIYSTNERYSPRDPATGHKLMFRARVLVGEWCVGAQDHKHPQRRRAGSTSAHDLCDSTVDNEANPSVFVTYRDDQTYPEYLITFK